MPGHSAYLNNIRQGPSVLAVGVGVDHLYIFVLPIISIFFLPFPGRWLNID